MKKLTWLLCSSLLMITACGPDEEPEPTGQISKEEARSLSGKGDHIDWCAELGWYGDGICDDFCKEPDPDCAPDCDDGSSVHPLCDIAPACEDGTIAAVQNGCFECVDPTTCEAPEEPETCDDGSAVNPLCDIRESCDDGLESVVQNGCFVCVDPDTCEPPDATGQMCAGFAGLQCPDGYVCEMDAGMCNVADAAGTCQPQADACIELYDPVCGCDGNTYSNSCFALLAGVSVDHAGECPATGNDDCGGFAGLTCEADEFCSYPLEAMCGAADQMGTCMPRPEACTAVYDPVCGCDGRTYSNGCMAASSGVSVVSEGACE